MLVTHLGQELDGWRGVPGTRHGQSVNRVRETSHVCLSCANRWQADCHPPKSRSTIPGRTTWEYDHHLVTLGYSSARDRVTMNPKEKGVYSAWS